LILREELSPCPFAASGSRTWYAIGVLTPPNTNFIQTENIAYGNKKIGAMYIGISCADPSAMHKM